MQAVRSGLKYTAVFIVVLAALTGMLVLVAKIPRSAIQENVAESAEYLCEGELFGMRVEGVQGSKIDRYADSILVAIAYQYDEEHPLESVMWSSYYYTEWMNENDNLLEAVTKGYEANQQYLRYWHGSNVIVRPLLLLFNIQEIYVLNGVVLAALIIILLAVLIRRKALIPAIGVAAGLILTSVWYVPFSVEYTWTYLLMLIMSIIGLKLAFAGRWKCLGFFFLIGGMLTNYVDFLTTETLTLLVPLLLILWVDRHQNQEKTIKSLFVDAGKAAGTWGCGYAGMWVMKWLMASAVLGENVLPYVSGHIEERLGNTEVAQWKYMPGALIRNLSCLFPLEYGALGAVTGIALLLLVIYIGYVYHKEDICRNCVLLYALVGLVPYLRYIVLLNHSYLHFFFTYRAQMATVVAVVLILEELTNRRWLAYADAGRRKP